MRRGANRAYEKLVADIVKEAAFQSLALTPAARTVIRTWPGPGCGSGRSTISRTSGPPNRLNRTASMSCSILDPEIDSCRAFYASLHTAATTNLQALTIPLKAAWGTSFPARVVVARDRR